MKRLVVVSALVLAVVLPVSVFAYSDGGYSGKHKGTAFEGEHGLSSLNFRVLTKRVHGHRKHYVQLYGAFTNIDCKRPNGSLKNLNLNFVRNGHSYAVLAKINGQREFAFDDTYQLYQGSATIQFNGKLSKASGSDSKGAGKLFAKQGTCKTPRVDWTASRVSQ